MHAFICFLWEIRFLVEFFASAPILLPDFLAISQLMFSFPPLFSLHMMEHAPKIKIVNHLTYIV